MSVFVIVLLLFVGILLCLLEVLVIPGVTVAGIGGFIAMAVGIYFSYEEFGLMAGHLILLLVVAINVIIIVYSLKSKTWNKLMLNSKVDSAVDSDIAKLSIGQTGKCITRLAPMGKILVGQYEVEGQSIGGLINEKTEVEIVKIENTKIIVKQI